MRYPGAWLIVTAVAWSILLFAGPRPISAQSAVVTGRVLEAGTTTGVANAIVELVGQSATLANDLGGFRLLDVPHGSYTLRITAFGYTTRALAVEVSGDTDLAIGLEIAPFQLDSLLVEPREISIEGEVRDGALDEPLYNADVLVNHEPMEQTSPRGRFQFDLWEGVPVLMSVRVFGYVARDTVITPSDDDRYSFDLVRDTVIDRLIARQVEILESRPTGVPPIGMPPFDRSALLRWTGVTLAEVLRGTYPTRIQTVSCLVIDEKAVPPAIAMDVLRSTLPGDVERMEFLFGSAMLRIYTREFMRNLIAGVAELVRPNYVKLTDGPPLCV